MISCLFAGDYFASEREDWMSRVQRDATLWEQESRGTAESANKATVRAADESRGSSHTRE